MPFEASDASRSSDQNCACCLAASVVCGKELVQYEVLWAYSQKRVLREKKPLMLNIAWKQLDKGEARRHVWHKISGAVPSQDFTLHRHGHDSESLLTFGTSRCLLTVSKSQALIENKSFEESIKLPRMWIALPLWFWPVGHKNNSMNLKWEENSAPQGQGLFANWDPMVVSNRIDVLQLN